MNLFSVEQALVANRPDIAVVTFHGEIDTNVLPQVEGAVNPLIEQAEVKSIVLDMSDTSYLNSRAVGLIMNFYGIMKERGRSLILVGLQAGVKDTLSLVGVTQLIPVYDTLEMYVQA